MIEYGKWKQDGHQPLMPQIADGCYAAGAKNVWYSVTRDINGKNTILDMVIELPKDKEKRAACFKVVNDFFKARAPEGEKKEDRYTDDDAEEEYLEVANPVARMW